MYSPMLCWNSLSIASKRTGSARLFIEELSAMLRTISSRKQCRAKDDFVLWEDGVVRRGERLFAREQRNDEKITG